MTVTTREAELGNLSVEMDLVVGLSEEMHK